MTPNKSLSTLVLSILLTLFLSSTALSSGDEPIAAVVIEATGMVWLPHVEYASLVLSVSAPNGEVFRREFDRGVNPSISLVDQNGGRLPDGQYTYELRLVPLVSAQTRAALAASRENGTSEAVTRELQRDGQLPTREVVQTGAFLVAQGAIVSGASSEAENPKGKASQIRTEQAITPAEGPVLNDQVTPDDLIVQGSACVGLDCVVNETFGFDTLRLKENNTRLTFMDTSTSTGYATRDWRLRANESPSGGRSAFFIDDLGDDHSGGDESVSSTPFTLMAGAPTNSIYLDSTGRLGLRTATPGLDVHVTTGNTPAFRMEQTTSGGFTAQTWDIGANEANFFVRDLTGGSRLPFRIRPGAPTSSIDISASGNVGIGTASPAYNLDVAGTVNATAFYLNGSPFTSPLSTSGTTTTNKMVKWSDGPAGKLTDSSVSDVGGNIGVGTSTPSYKLVVGPDLGAGFSFVTATVSKGPGQSASILVGPSAMQAMEFGWDNANSRAFVNSPSTNVIAFMQNGSERMRINSAGNVGIGTSAPQSSLQVNGYVQLALTAGAPPAADCDNAAEHGRMKVDATGNKLYVCTSTGWKSTTLVP
ncbi:MAG TPA: hypothetical protein VF735_05800 [Pyrinomonadaceae bacterium]|jgi:hypothetical protein